MYSYAASCRQGLANWTCFWCKYLPGLPPVHDAYVFSDNGIYGIYGYVGATDDTIIISFRGSESLENWFDDLDFFQVEYPGIPGAQVHQGFLYAYSKVQIQVVQKVLALRKRHPTFPIYVSGHSLGGALSVLCGFDLVHSRIIPSNMISVVNIGQPRVGNQLWASKFHEYIGTSYRIVNKRDLVPHVPPRFFGFHHVSTEIWFPSNFTDFVVCDGSGEDLNCSDSLQMWNPMDHLYYAGYFSRDQGAYDANCGPIHTTRDQLNNDLRAPKLELLLKSTQTRRT